MDLGSRTSTASGRRRTRGDLNGDGWRDAVNCHLPLAEVGSWLNKTSGAPVADADYTNLYYCGLGKPTAQKIDDGHPKQTWVDHFGNALYATSDDAVPGCSGASDTKCGYGPGKTIDTTKDYDVKVMFDWDSADGHLKGFNTTLTQGANTVTLPRITSPNAARCRSKAAWATAASRFSCSCGPPGTTA